MIGILGKMEALLSALVWIFAAAALAMVVVALRKLRARGRMLDGLFEGEVEPTVGEESEDSGRGALQRWLYVSGFRRASSKYVFLAGAIAAAVVGVIVGFSIRRSEIGDTFRTWLVEIPGGSGDLLLPIVWLGPWIVFSIFASIPWTVVRASRRRIISEIEEDLPATAEIFATLGEAGLGFDSAVDRVLGSAPENRALFSELRLYRRDLLSGVSRAVALRNIAERVDVPHVSTIVSALVQADQVGAGLSGVLRQQADDLRHRRRERAVRLAQSLPVKLTVPLVVCFFPASVIGVLGPTFYQISQMLESYIQR